MTSNSKNLGSASLWLLILTVSFLFTGCSRPSTEIEKILVARARAQAHLEHTARIKQELILVAGGDSNAILINPVRYAEALQKIDASRAPSDFKSAWKNYVAAWQLDDGIPSNIPSKYYSVKVVPAATGEPSPPTANTEQTGNSTAIQNQTARRAAWVNLKQHLHGAVIAGDDF